MGLYSIPGYDAWKLDHPDNYATDPAECPDWLAEELSALPAFVNEALSERYDRIAAAVIEGDAGKIKAVADEAVAAYIDLTWEVEGRDAHEISRSWRAFDAQQQARRAAA